MLRAILVAVVVLGAAAPSGAAAPDAATAARRDHTVEAHGEPRAFPPRAGELTAMLGEVEGRCREAATRVWRGGATEAACAATMKRASRRQLRRTPTKFGVVLHRKVDLVGARLVLARASGCREWPSSPRGLILGESDALAAGCQLRPYRGTLALVVVDEHGRREQAVRVHADREGIVSFRFADVDAAVRERGLGTLDEWAALEAGFDGWGGRFDLERLRGFLADWHLSWVRRGRGSPGLFALRHRGHPRSQIAVDLALEASLARQRRDFAAVERGTLPAATFLDRYVWSPMRRSVESMLAEFRNPSAAPGPTTASASTP